MAETEEAPLMKLSLQLTPESIKLLKDFAQRLHAVENELKEIKGLFSQALYKFFEVQ
jgi:uncharacterized protein with GYD domain